MIYGMEILRKIVSLAIRKWGDMKARTPSGVRVIRERPCKMGPTEDVSMTKPPIAAKKPWVNVQGCCRREGREDAELLVEFVICRAPEAEWVVVGGDTSIDLSTSSV